MEVLSNDRLAFGVHHVAEALAHFEHVHHRVASVLGAAAAEHVGPHLDHVHDRASSAIPKEWILLNLP